MVETIGSRIKNGKLTKWSIMFLIALLIYEISAGIEMTVLGGSEIYMKIADVLKAVSIVILLVGAVTHIKYYSIAQWIAFGLLGILSAACTYTSKSAAPLLAFAFWINLAEVDMDDILRVYLIVISVVFVFAVLMCLIGVFPDMIFEENDHGIGFIHSNSAAAAQMCIILTYMTLRYGKLRWYEWVLMGVFAGIIFWFTGSRCMLIASAAAIVLGLIINCFKNMTVNKVVGVLSVIACPLFWIGSYIVAAIYSEKISALVSLNHMLKGRLALGTHGIEDMGVHMLGQKILWSSGNEISPVTGEIIPYNIVDSSYLSILISYGWAYALVILLLYTAFALYVYKRQKWNWSVAILVILICGLVEGTMITIVCNPVLIALGLVFFSKYFAKRSEGAK